MGRLPLLSEERDAVAAFRSSLQALEATDGHGVPDADAVLRVHAALHRLNNVNLRYIEVGYSSNAAHSRKLAVLVIALGVASMFAAPFFGYLVRRAIVPRVETLVRKVKRFRELGVDEPLGPWAGDELAVLANALDTAFAAIAARDKDREHFLAVAAHELKTPLTSLKGFAHVALTHRDDVEVRDRALTVIERQSMRLARLVQELLWTASVDAGRAGFHPGPIDLEALTRKVIAETQATTKAHPFVLEVHGDTHVLADPYLLGLSLSSLLAEAATMVPAGAPVPVRLQAVNGAIRLTIEAREANVPESDLEHLLEPFALLRYEGRDQQDRGRSTGLGLHLTRQIAALHTASFRVESAGPHSVAFVMDLRR
jgi:signal transduction histidine kinase